MNEKACNFILGWLSQCDDEEVDIDWPMQEYEEVIFSKWALEEILQLVWDHPWTLASETIMRFGLSMFECFENACTDEQRRIFRIAGLTAWELLENIEEVEE